MKRIVPLLLAAVLFGCSSGDKDDQKQATAQIYPVPWNLTNAELAPVHTLADLSDTIVFFNETSAVVMVEGEVQGESAPVGPFRGAATIPAADGTGRWIVGLDAKGHILRVRLHDASVEDISGRYGFEATEVRAIAALGASDGVAFLLADALAIADGERVRHWNVGPAKQLAATDARVALLDDNTVRVFDVKAGTIAQFSIHSPRAAAFGGDGRMYVAAGRSVYREEGGRLIEIHEASAPIHSLVGSGKRVWFGAGSDLGVINEQGSIVVGAGAATGVTTLVPSMTGDVWAIASGTVMRFAAAGGDSSAGKTWEAEIKPIFDKNCAACHLPGGLSGIDLSTFDQWNVMRSSLMKRVVVEQNMPPRNSKALSDPDREKIREWLTGHLE